MDMEITQKTGVSKGYYSNIDPREGRKTDWQQTHRYKKDTKKQVLNSFFEQKRI